MTVETLSVTGTKAGTFRRHSVTLGAAAALMLILPLASACSEQSTPKQAAAPAASEAASPNDKVVARVSGADIRESDIAIAEEDLGSDLQNVPEDQRREQVIAYLADLIMASKAAEAAKLGDTPEFRRRLELNREKLLMGLQLQAIGKAALTDEAMRQVYDDATKSMRGQEEVRARHILVETEDEAKAILEEIKKGADFATVAKEKSKDPGASDGGDLGYFTKEQMVPEFSNVAFQMYNGQVSNPIKTQFGWHIIKVEDKRQKPVPEFDKVKDQIEAFVTRKAQTEYVAKLREANKVERLDQPAKPAPAPAAPAPAPSATPAPAPAK